MTESTPDVLTDAEIGFTPIHVRAASEIININYEVFGSDLTAINLRIPHQHNHTDRQEPILGPAPRKLYCLIRFCSSNCNALQIADLEWLCRQI